MGNKRSQPQETTPPLPRPTEASTDIPGKGNMAKEQKIHSPGEGIRSMKTSQAFRALNFELYAKPNKTVMIFGVTCFALTAAYLIYMRHSYNKGQFYEAYTEEGTIVLREKKSRWDS